MKTLIEFDEKNHKYSTKKERNKAYKKIIDTYTAKEQLYIAIEEMAELQKEITKTLRGKNNREAFIEELTDAEIMIEQLKLIFDIKQKHVDSYKEMKINRTLEEIEKLLMK